MTPSSSISFLVISIRAPARGATISAALCAFTHRFQSALPRGERHDTEQFHQLLSDFNPRSREGSDGRFDSFFQQIIISIRAPARGATINGNIADWTMDISIRAPARGATCRADGDHFRNRFQSALPRGERHQFSPKSSLLS